jgi:ATP-dependent exoDNAse (exonuclease V) alpha subunit
MEQIKQPNVKFLATETAIIAGQKFADESKNLPADRELNLKIGAQVMFVKNDDLGITKFGRRRWANGTTGIVTSFSPDQTKVFVRIDDKVEEVVRSTWTKYIYSLVEETNPVNHKKAKALKALEAAQYSQIPLRAAWAITIHKSQGQTYDDVIVDMPKGAFASGQSYVALSRVKQIAGMVLTTPLKVTDVSVDPDAKNMLNRVVILNKPRSAIK